MASLGIQREATAAAGDQFLWGEGSRCRSSNVQSATDFVRQVIKADVPANERVLLANARLKLLGTCDWQGSAAGAAVDHFHPGSRADHLPARRFRLLQRALCMPSAGLLR